MRRRDCQRLACASCDQDRKTSRDRNDNCQTLLDQSFTFYHLPISRVSPRSLPRHFAAIWTGSQQPPSNRSSLPSKVESEKHPPAVQAILSPPAAPAASKPKCWTRKSARRLLPPAISPRIRGLPHSAARTVRLILSSLLAFHLRRPRVLAHSHIVMFVPADSGYGIYSRNGLPCWPTPQLVSVSYLRSHFGKPKFSMVSNNRFLIGSPVHHLPLCAICAKVVFSSHHLSVTRIFNLTPSVVLHQSRSRSTVPLAAKRRVLWLCCPLWFDIHHHIPYVLGLKYLVCLVLTIFATSFSSRVPLSTLMLLKLCSSPAVIFHPDHPLGLYLWTVDRCGDILRCRAIRRDCRVCPISRISPRAHRSLVTINAGTIPSRAGNRTQTTAAVPCPPRTLSVQCHECPSRCNDPEYEDLYHLYRTLPFQGDCAHKYRRRDQVVQCE